MLDSIWKIATPIMTTLRNATSVPLTSISSALTALVSTPSVSERSSAEPHPVWELFGGDTTNNLLFAGPTHECVCGNNVFLLLAWFEDKQIAGYFTEAVCSSCRSIVRAPTEADSEEEMHND